jgi:hypothetical protein
MNGLARDNSMTKSPRLRRLQGVALAACVLAAPAAALSRPCQATAETEDRPAINAAIAAEAERVSHAPGPYPRFCDIPPTPTDVRPPIAWAATIADVNAAGAETQAQGAISFAPDQPTESFVDEAVRDGTAPPAQPIPSTEAFVRDARGRATPPPRPQ